MIKIKEREIPFFIMALGVFLFAIFQFYYLEAGRTALILLTTLFGFIGVGDFCIKKIPLRFILGPLAILSMSVAIQGPVLTTVFLGVLLWFIKYGSFGVM